MRGDSSVDFVTEFIRSPSHLHLAVPGSSGPPDSGQLLTATQGELSVRAFRGTAWRLFRVESGEHGMAGAAMSKKTDCNLFHFWDGGLLVFPFGGNVLVMSVVVDPDSYSSSRILRAVCGSIKLSA